MRFYAALLALFIVSFPSAAKCSCGSGASGGYNFLGDPSFDIDMTSFDEFSQATFVANKMKEPVSYDSGSAKEGSAKKDMNNSMDNISIDLDDGSSIDLVLYPAGENLYGMGNIIPGDAGAGSESAENASAGNVSTGNVNANSMGTPDALGAAGVWEGDRLIVEMVSLSGDLYRVDLHENKSELSGDFAKITPNREVLWGTAKGAVKGAANGVTEGNAVGAVNGIAKRALPKNVVVIGASIPKVSEAQGSSL